MSSLPLLHTIPEWFLSRSRSFKRVFTLLADITALELALWLAFSLRYGEFYSPEPSQLWIFLLAPVLAIPVFIRLGLYRAIVRYIGM